MTFHMQKVNGSAGFVQRSKICTRLTDYLDHPNDDLIGPLVLAHERFRALGPRTQLVCLEGVELS